MKSVFTADEQHGRDRPGYEAADPPESPHYARAERDLRRVWDRLRRPIEDGLAELDDVVVAALDGAVDVPTRQRCATRADELASLLGRLSMSAGADLARAISSEASSVSDIAGPQLASRLRDIRSSLEVSEEEVGQKVPSGVKLLVVGNPSSFADHLVWAAAQGRMVVCRASGANADLADTDPDVVVVADPGMSTLDHRAALVALRRVFPDAPHVLVADDSDFVSRLPVSSLVDDIVSTSSRFDDMVAAFHETVSRRRSIPVSVMGSETGRVLFLVDELGRRGVPATTLDGSTDVFEVLGSSGPQVFVLDGADRSRSALRWCQALRTDSIGRSSTVILLADDARPHDVLAAKRAGVDDVLASDVSTSDLASRVDIARRRLAQLAPSLSGSRSLSVAGWPNTAVRLERALLAAQRQDWVVSVAVMVIDEVALNEAGREAGTELQRIAERLVGEFRRDDIIGRTERNTFVVALQRAGHAAAAGRMERLVTALQVPPAAARVAVAEFPSDGRRLHALLDEASETLQRSRESDGPAITTTRWRPGVDERIDVLLADGDEGLTAVLGHALTRRGYEVGVAGDGLAALEVAGGDGSTPRVMVMDLNLPGMDGLQLLRHLRERGRIQEMTVILLTANPRETDLVEALELGVAEYVAKPFSAAVLHQRIKRALEASP